MSAPFNHGGNRAFVQPGLAHPEGRGSVRPVASAAPAGSAVDHAANPLGHRDSLPAQRPRPPKRTNITPVACQPCQQRKHKCDGARPVCTPCFVKRRSDCAYDAAGDQRRTSSLKQRIRDLETEVDDLKDVIESIGSAADSDAAVALANQLAHGRFLATAEVARALRAGEDVQAALSLAIALNRPLDPAIYGDVAASNISEASPSSAATGDNIEFDGSGDATAMSWATNAAQGDTPFLQDEFNSTPMEAAGSSDMIPPTTCNGTASEGKRGDPAPRGTT